MEQTLVVANSSMMWILALALIGVVLLQVAIFFRIAWSYVKETQALSAHEINASFKVGAVSTLGPAMAVFAIAVALIAQIGGPITLSRVGVIGSAAYEFIAARIGSGGTVGTPEFTGSMLAAASWVMTLGGSGWLLVTLFTTKRLDTLQENANKMNPLIVAYMASFTPFIIFLTLTYKEVDKGMKAGSSAQLVAVVTGGIVMWAVHFFAAKNEKLKWLREWAMGFAVVGAMITGSIAG
ncbi:MAG: DUF5058 family protein [Desulfobulbales bacterium]